MALPRLNRNPMKKIYLILFTCLAFLNSKATSFTVNISGFSYSPSSLTVTVGDVITIGASGIHPLVQVDAAAFAAPSNTAMAGGWGVQSATYTFTVATVGTIYYVCQNHYLSGMKGSITVNATGVVENTAFINQFNLYPNPAQNNVQIGFNLTNSSNVSVKLFNLLGQEVSVLTPNTFLAEGNYNLNYELPSSISNGSYFMELSSNDKKSTKKLLVNK